MISASSEISSFSPEEAPRFGRVCSSTGRQFEIGDKVFSYLYEEDGVIKRNDVSASAWRANPRPANALAWWSFRVREDSGKDLKLKLAPNDALTGLFVALANKPEQAALRYALTLLLVRRKVLKFDYDENIAARNDPETANTIYVYSSRNETGYRVPIVEMTGEQIAEVQERLVKLLEEPNAALEEAKALDEKKAGEKVKEKEKNVVNNKEKPRESIPFDADRAAKLKAAFAEFDAEFAKEAAHAAQATGSVKSE